MKNKKIFIGILALFFLSFTLSSAQTRTGNLTGLVEDEESTPLPGVEVVISSPELIVPQLIQVTNDRGFFRFAYLPPGTYRLTAKLSGFAAYSEEGIAINLGLTTAVKIQMKTAVLEEELTVTARAPLIAIEDTELSTNIGSKELSYLPIRRNLTEVFGLAPGIAKGTEYPGAGGASLGAGQRENAFYIDGVYVTDPGSAILKVYQPLDSYEEMEIETAGHKAEFGNASGGILNVVTKSGGNYFSGEASLYFRNKDLQATNHEGTGLDAPSSETLSYYDANFSLGGPIIKDKIWFFLSTMISTSKERTYGFPADRPFAKFYPLGKLTFQLSPRHRISLSYNYNRGHEPYFQGSALTDPDACFDTFYKGNSMLINWLYTINPDTILEVRGARVFNPNKYLSRTQDVYIRDYGTGRTSNSRNDCIQERIRWQFQTSITRFLDGFGGDHEIKAGFEFENGQSQNKTNWFPDQYEMTSYYLQNGAPYTSVAVKPAKGDYQTVRYYQYAGYLQDTWKINRFVVANIGFRFSYIDSQVPPQGSLTEKKSLWNWKFFEPRIGLGFDPLGDGKTGIKLNFARYSMLMWTWYYGLAPRPQVTDYYWNPSPGVFNYRYSSTPGTYEIDPNLAKPYVDELLLSIDRIISKDWSVKASFIYRQFRKFVTIEDSGRTPDWYDPITVMNPISNQHITVYDLRIGAPAPINYYTNTEVAKRDYKAFMLGINKKLSYNFQLRASYTWSQSKGTVAQTYWGSSGMSAGGGWNNPNALINNSGFLDVDRTHIIKFQGIYFAPYGFVLGLNYFGASGTPYTKVFNAYLNQGGVGINGEPMGSNRTPFTHTVDLKLQKEFLISNLRVSFFFDVFNLVNSNAKTSIYSLYGSPLYLKPTAIQTALLAQIGARIIF